MKKETDRTMPDHELVLWLQVKIDTLDEKIKKLTSDRDILKELRRIAWDLE